MALLDIVRALNQDRMTSTLTVRSISMLVAIATADDPSPIPVAESVALTSVAASRAMAALRANGLAKQARLEGDRRRVRLSLTPRGRALVDRLTQEARA